MWRYIATMGAALIAVLATSGVANATTNITADSGWQSFITGGGIGGASTAGPWVFTSPTVAKVTVTDAFCHGDEFRVYDKDVLLGETSDVASEFPACPFQLFFPAIARADAALGRLGRMQGKIVQFLPDVAFVRVKLGEDESAEENDLAYTLLSDRAYDNVSSMFAEHKLGEPRDASRDRQTVVPWLEGSYPEFFFVLRLADVERFAEQYDSLQTRSDYERFTERFGVRRTNPHFWQASDWFNAQALREQPERGGILDLNRYQDR